MTFSTRPLSLAQHGMASSPHYLASLTGLQVLQDGGTAVDAAIAVNATLGVVYPHMTGVGGDAFWLIHDASTGRTHALNGSGRAGAAADRARFAALGHSTIPTRGPLAAITVPGAVDSWCTAHGRFGRLPLRRLLEPAVDYARNGHPACGSQARFLHEVREVLESHDASRRTLLPGGEPPRQGQIVRYPRLAATMEAIARHGRDGFYTGEVAAEAAAALQHEGGLLTAEDFAAHTSQWMQPLSTSYRGYDCLQHPPNSQGFAHLMMLNILKGFDLAGMGDQSPEYLHTVVEATKQVFALRDRHLTDPAFADIPLDDLLSPARAKELRGRVGARAAPGGPQAALGSDTTCSVVVDGAGNAASVIQSLYHECGSGFVAGDTGILLQNRGSFFSLDESHVNRLEPGKRTFHTLMPGMLLRDGRPYLVYGTMGGEGQPQTSTALVTRIVDFGQEVQQAIDGPRWLYGRTWGDPTQALRLESRFDGPTRTRLADLGHPVQTVSGFDAVMGHAQAILIDPDDGVLMGGADPRGEGIALGW